MCVEFEGRKCVHVTFPLLPDISGVHNPMCVEGSPTCVEGSPTCVEGNPTCVEGNPTCVEENPTGLDCCC